MNLTAVILLLLSPFSHAQDVSEWKAYKGAWFAIEYPPDFIVKPSLKSTSAKGYYSAYFASPDGSVKFYVFSPQWNGLPSDFALNPETEEYISEKIEDQPDRVQKATRQKCE